MVNANSILTNPIKERERELGDLQRVIDDAPDWAWFYCECSEKYISQPDCDNLCAIGTKSELSFASSSEVSLFNCITVHQAKQALKLQEMINLLIQANFK